MLKSFLQEFLYLAPITIPIILLLKELPKDIFIVGQISPVYWPISHNGVEIGIIDHL
jgi:hypothetical protein